MKLTWFGGATFRLHAGGQIVVVNAYGAPLGVDRQELTGGADRVISPEDSLPATDGARWRARPAQRLLDAGDAERPIEIWGCGPNGVIVDADGERPVLLSLGADAAVPGNWIASGVAVLAGEQLAPRTLALLDATPPRFIALAGSEAELDATLATVRDRLEGTSLVALEPGMAVEL
jgi:hypothetical protein